MTILVLNFHFFKDISLKKYFIFSYVVSVCISLPVLYKQTIAWNACRRKMSANQIAEKQGQ